MTTFFNKKSKSYLEDPDVQLMLDFQSGDKRAFETLMTKYFPRLLNFIYKFVHDKELAEDLTQDVFIKVYKSANKYSPGAKFQTWIYTIAKNVALNELRRHKNKMVSIDENLDSKEGHYQRQIPDQNAVQPDADVLQQERKRIVKAAIEGLPESQRLAVILQRYEGLSYEDIAQSLETSVKAVKSLLNRAKENLKNKLSEHIKNDNL